MRLTNTESKSVASPIINKREVFLGVVAFLVLVSPIAYLGFKGSQKSPGIRIDLRNKTDKSQDNNYFVDECDNCERLVIRDKNGDKFFEESLKETVNPGENKLREYLISKAKQTRQQNSSIKLFYNQFPNRLVDISFDISNSVIDKEKASIEIGADIKYTDLIFQKFKEYMKKNQKMKPHDQIKLRYYGPDFKNNPCNSSLSIKFAEWEFLADITYSERNKQILIEIGDRLSSLFNKTDQNLTANNEDDIYRVIKDYYDKGSSNPNSDCHFGTYLIPHITEIHNEIKNKDYSDFEFVLITDGEFYLNDPELTAGKNTLVGSKNFEILENYLQKDGEKISPPICKKSDDKFTIAVPLATTWGYVKLKLE